MRTRLLLLIIALSLLGSSGCEVLGRGLYNLTYKACECVSEQAECLRNHQWAQDAWDEVRMADPGHAWSWEYGDGFKEGFENYLWRGGHGEPPPMPPPRYRKVRYQTPQGYQLIEDWFAGYRHGASVARAGGYREWITGPSSLRKPQPPAPPALPAPVAPLAPPPELPLAPPPEPVAPPLSPGVQLPAADPAGKAAAQVTIPLPIQPAAMEKALELCGYWVPGAPPTAPADDQVP